MFAPRRSFMPRVSSAMTPRDDGMSSSPSASGSEWPMDMSSASQMRSSTQEGGANNGGGIRRAYTNSDMFGQEPNEIGGRIFVPMHENSALNNWNSEDHPWRSRWNTFGMWPWYLWCCFILIIGVASITDVDMTTSPAISRLPFITYYGIVIANLVYSTLTAVWMLVLERNWYQYEIKDGGKGISQWPAPSQLSAPMFVGWGFHVTAAVFVFILNNDVDDKSITDTQYIMRYKRIAGLIAVGAAFASCEVMMRFFAIIFGRWLIKDDDKAYLKLQGRGMQAASG